MGDLLQVFAPFTVSSIMFDMDLAPLLVVVLTAVFYFLEFLVTYGLAAKLLKAIRGSFKE